jgi:hypothetical protein
MEAAPGMAPQQVRGIEGEIIVTGRVTGTKAAQEKTAEPVLIIRDLALAAQYRQHWDAHQRHRQPSVRLSAWPPVDQWTNGAIVRYHLS